MKAIYNKEIFTLEEVKEILYDFVESEEVFYITSGYYPNDKEQLVKQFIENNLIKNESRG